MENDFYNYILKKTEEEKQNLFSAVEQAVSAYPLSEEIKSKQINEWVKSILLNYDLETLSVQELAILSLYDK